MTDVQHRNSGRWPRWAGPAYVILFVLAVPWYFPRESPGTLIFGMPVWAASSLGFSALISILTAYLALFRWPERAEGSRDGV
jgi:hypothetical protein